MIPAKPVSLRLYFVRNSLSPDYHGLYVNQSIFVLMGNLDNSFALVSSPIS